ncbi:MAG: hypothetical protein KDD43_06545 [Bdellovibrionales bacterium]|nr:hypothetical protein [Bdellovibrionales bacterium]
MPGFAVDVDAIGLKLSNRSPLASQRGFSLVQVVMAVGILGILTLATLRSTTFFMTSLHATTQTTELRGLGTDLSLFLRDDGICTSTFQGVLFPGPDVTLLNLNVKSGIHVFFSLAPGLFGSGLDIKTIKLIKNPPVPVSTKTVAGIVYDKYVVNLELTSEKSDDVLGARGNRPVVVPLMIYIAQVTGAIDSCASSSSAQEICEQLFSGTLVGAKCRMKTHTKRYRTTGVRFNSFQGPGVLQGAGGDLLGVTNYEVGFNEWQVQAPRCPPNTTIIGCNTTMITGTGRSEEYYNRDYDWDQGGTIMGVPVDPAIWWVNSYLDNNSLDGEGRPNCVMRIYRGVIEGAFTEYYPTAICAAHDPALLP